MRTPLNYAIPAKEGGRNVGGAIGDITSVQSELILHRLGSTKILDDMVIAINPGDTRKKGALKVEHLCKIYYGKSEETDILAFGSNSGRGGVECLCAGSPLTELPTPPQKMPLPHFFVHLNFRLYIAKMQGKLMGGGVYSESVQVEPTSSSWLPWLTCPEAAVPHFP